MNSVTLTTKGKSTLLMAFLSEMKIKLPQGSSGEVSSCAYIGFIRLAQSLYGLTQSYSLLKKKTL